MTRKHFFVLAISIAALSTACSSSQKKPEVAAKPAPVEVKKPVEEVVKKSSDVELVCTQGEDTRKVIIKKKNPGCDVHYSKFNDSNQVAWAIATPSLCDQVQDKIRANLEAGNFTCKEGDSERKTASLKK